MLQRGNVEINSEDVELVLGIAASLNGWKFNPDHFGEQ